MKAIFKHRFIVIVLNIIISTILSNTVNAKENFDQQVTYQTFYDNLSPYGTWIDYPNYGHVWNPNLDTDFRPYATNGHWVSTIDGWAWSSDYNWGWAPFHYGSWLYDDMYGWLWIPGYDWSPAWVTWGIVDNYYCWAPIIPGLDLTIGFENWRPNSFYWNACSRDHFYDRNLDSVMERPDHFANFQNRISLINNYDRTENNHFYYSKGPEVRDVEKFANTKIEQTNFREGNSSEKVNYSGNEMWVYRPRIQNPNETIQQFPEQNIKPVEYRKAEVEQSMPMNSKEQLPTFQRDNQTENIARLPVFRSERYAGQNLNQGRTIQNIR